MTAPEEVKQLWWWSQFLDAQAAYFNAATLREVGHLRVADEINVAFLKTDDVIALPEIEKAVNVFIRDGAWPQKLGERVYHHLSAHRAFLARKLILTVLLAMLDDGDPSAADIRGQLRFIGDPKPAAARIRTEMPDLDDRKRMIHWLFIDMWNKHGKTFLDGLTDAFLKTRPL
jgi:hypothetical protein